MLRHIIALAMMFFAASLWASADESTQLTEPLIQENSKNTCSCDIRHQQHVAARLLKLKKLELLQEQQQE
jgi:hypothetical protein